MLYLLLLYLSYLLLVWIQISFRLLQSEASRQTWKSRRLNLLIFSHSLAIKILVFFRILLMEILEIPVKFAILVVSISFLRNMLENFTKFIL